MRYHGIVGYEIAADNGDGVWLADSGQPVERCYYGEVTRNLRRYESGSKVNDDLATSNAISIVADAYAFANFMHIRYVEWCGEMWKVTNVELQPPRIVLTVGGLYHGYDRNREVDATGNAEADPGE